MENLLEIRMGLVATVETEASTLPTLRRDKVKFKIYKGESHINTIVGEEAFVKSWCDKNGYTCEEVPPSKPQEEPQEIDTAQIRADIDYLSIMLGVELL